MHRMALRDAAPLLGLLGLALATLPSCEKSPTSPIGDSRAVIIVYASDRLQTPGQYDLYLFDLSGLGNTLSTQINSLAAPDLHPTVTPNGGTVAFESTRSGGEGGSDIYFFDRGNNIFLAVPGVNTAADETEPSFSRSGQFLAFTQTEGGFKQVRVFDGLAHTLVALPGLNTPTSNNQSPSPDRNATKIAFVSDRNGNPDVFVYDAAGDSLLSLPDLVSDSTDADPCLTPDGHYLAFASSRPGGAGGLDLYLYDLTTKSFVTLTPGLNTDKTERFPSLNLNATFITFQSDRTAIGAVGGMDVWNYNRTSSAIGQPVGLSSTASDVQPFLLYP